MMLRRRDERGFSLLELVVVVSVLSVLSAIAIPNFVCFIKESKAAAALAAMKQIQTECNFNKTSRNQEVFTASGLEGYQIQSGGANRCEGTGANGLISAIPDDTNELPMFIYSSTNGLLTYDYKGNYGTDLTECVSLICGNSATIKEEEEDEIEKEHDPDLDPFHGDKCTKFRSSMYYDNGRKLVTGCYGDRWQFLRDPCGDRKSVV